MVTWLLQAIAYALLGAAVLMVNWHRPATRLVGAALLAFSLISSATYFMHPPFALRALREVVLVTGIATMCSYMLFIGDARRPYRIAMALCTIDVAFCGAIFLLGDTGHGVRVAFVWMVNIIYVGLCACISAPGVRDAYDAWIADIERVRRLDSSAPDFDWAIRKLDR